MLHVVAWQCQGKQDLPGMREGVGKEPGSSCMGWCNPELQSRVLRSPRQWWRSPRTSSQPCWCFFVAVGRNGIRAYDVDRSREGFAGNIFQMPTCDAGTRAPLCTQCLVRLSGSKPSLKWSLDLSQSRFVPCARCCVSRLLPPLLRQEPCALGARIGWL